MRILPALTALLLLAIPAAAQNDNVTVNGSGDGQTLIDPATGESRYVPPLLQPWQDGVIRLRPPGRHRAHKPATTAMTAPATTSTADITPVAPPPKKVHRAAAVIPPPVTPPPVATPKPAAAPKPAAKAPLSGFGDIDLITGTGQQTQQSATPPKPAAAPPKVAVTPPKPVVTPPKVAAMPPKPVVAPPKVAATLPKPVVTPTRTASIEKPKARTSTGARKDSITFAPNATDPSGSAVTAVRTLASSLSGSMDESARVQLMAYGGQKGEKSSDTRRLSLKRALVIRQLLIDDGIPAERIDVFALGGADDDGPLDRVDVFLKG
jgi:outer membrane protein OmpA-like peptidoglycan-associated protein